MEKVLVVDDDPVTRRLIAAALEKRGLVTVQASDGQRGLQLAQDNRDISLIVTDYQMPHLSGEQLVLEVRGDAHLKHVPVVMTSGVVPLKDISNLLDRGVSYFLSKPIDINELEEYVAKALFNIRNVARSKESNQADDSPVNPEYLEICQAAVKEVIGAMAQISVTKDSTFRKSTRKTWGDVSGFVSLMGETHTGSMVLSFQKDAILEIVSAMFDEQITDITREVVDAVGELSNVISSRARAILSEHDVVLGMARPVLLSGRDVEISQAEQGEVISTLFTTPRGQFVVEIDLVERV